MRHMRILIPTIVALFLTMTTSLAMASPPIMPADSDGDFLSDDIEVTLGTDPLLADTDSDSRTDGDEHTWGSDPLVPDTVSDDVERSSVDVAVPPEHGTHAAPSHRGATDIDGAPRGLLGSRTSKHCE